MDFKLFSTWPTRWLSQFKTPCLRWVISFKLKQSQRIGMDSVSDICKYHLLCFVTIIEVKVISGHQVKKVNKKIVI